MKGFPVSVPAQRLSELLRSLALLFFAGAALALLFLDAAGKGTVTSTRASLLDVAAPVMDGLSRPVAMVSTGLERLGGLLEMHEENRRLREQNARLLRWRDAAQALETENRSLREVARLVPEHGAAATATARVIGDPGGAFVRSVLVAAGAADGVAPGDAVVDGAGLVGRVSEAGRNAARVLLVTDINSRIPVVVGEDRHRAILSGDNSGLPRLEFLAPSARLSAGARVATSGHGELFPPGLPVGRLVGGDGGDRRLRPFADLDRLAHVRVITAFPGQASLGPAATPGEPAPGR